jgi:hypothetical protein
MNRGVTEFYYTKKVPSRGISIAEITALPSTPADLVDINDVDHTNTAILPGSLAIVGNNNGALHTYDAKVIGNSVSISLATTYYLKNQFFEITNKTLDGTITGIPLYYKHTLPGGVTDVTILDFAGQEVTGYKVESSVVYHSFEGQPLWIRFYSSRLVQTQLLKYTPVMTRAIKTNTNQYIFNHGVLKLNTSSTHHVRFTAENGYRVLAPHNVLANDPWYARIRFTVNPPAPEYAIQPFLPNMPYHLATWVPGKVAGPRVIEFERRPMFTDGSRYPDVLIFDKEYNLKYALDGSPANTPNRKGYLYPWKRSQFAPEGLDAYKARVHLLVDVEACRE